MDPSPLPTTLPTTLLPFGWSEGQAQAISAIVQAGTAILILLVTLFLAGLTIYQHRQAGKAERERLAEERIAAAGLLTVDAPFVSGSRVNVAVRNLNSTFALDAWLTMTAGKVSAEIGAGDLAPDGFSTFIVDISEFLEMPDEDGKPRQWIAPEIDLEIAHTGQRGQRVRQFFSWAPDRPDLEADRADWIQDAPVIDAQVKEVEPRRVI